MRTVISIVSHGQQAMILENELAVSASSFEIIVRENIPGSKRKLPETVNYLENLRPAGFGVNHNKNFESAHLEDQDWFLICNPDIIATPEQVIDLLENAEKNGALLAAPTLWNRKKNEFDHNVRPRVRPLSLALSFAKLPNKSRYSEEALNSLTEVDWASGAFLAIKAGLFRKLGGFDPRYFMYMEDVDLCCRARAIGEKVRYIRDTRIIHNAARDNRRLFSANFAYHLRSVVRFFVL